MVTSHFALIDYDIISFYSINFGNITRRLKLSDIIQSSATQRLLNSQILRFFELERNVLVLTK